jgi:Fe-S cluster assembly iron-binding protein IscA
MFTITQAARTRLQQLLAEHPEEHVVRLAVKDVDEERLALSITLEDAAKPEDSVQEIQGLTMAMAANSVARLDGATLDYTDSAGFHLQHPTSPVQQLRVISLN